MDRGRSYGLPYNRLQRPRFQSFNHQSLNSNNAQPRSRPTLIANRFQSHHGRSTSYTCSDTNMPNNCFNQSMQDSYTRNTQPTGQFSDVKKFEQNRCRPRLLNLSPQYRTQFESSYQQSNRNNFVQVHSRRNWSPRKTISGSKSSQYTKTGGQYHEKTAKQSLKLESYNVQADNSEHHVLKGSETGHEINATKKNKTVHEIVHENNNDIVHENNNDIVHENNNDIVHENNDETVHENNNESVHKNKNETAHENNNETVHKNNNEAVHENNNKTGHENSDVVNIVEDGGSDLANYCGVSKNNDNGNNNDVNDSSNDDDDDDDYLPPTYLLSIKPKHNNQQSDDNDDGTRTEKSSCYTLDNLYLDHQNQVVQVKERHEFNEELQNDLKHGGFLNPLNHEEIKPVDTLTEKQNYILEQFKVKESKLQNEWPGKVLFQSETYQCLFNASLHPTHCGYVIPDKPTRLERHLGSISVNQYKFLLTSKLHVQLFMKITHLDKLLRWLYLLMSVSDDIDIQNGCEELLMNVLHTQCMNDVTKWTPSFIDFLSILVNYGANLESLLPCSPSEVEIVSAYTVETIQQCLTSVIKQYTDYDWLYERVKVCHMLLNVSSHHHDQNHIAQILPPGERGFYIQQRYCYLVISKILTGNSQVSDNELNNFEIGYLEKFISYITDLLHNDLYVLTSVIRMIDLCVGMNYSHSTKNMEQLKSLKERLSRVRIKDDICMLDRSRVKNMIVIVTGRWALDLQTVRRKQRQIFEYTNTNNKDVKMQVETLKPIESDNDDDDDDNDSNDDDDDTLPHKIRKLSTDDSKKLIACYTDEPNTLDIDKQSAQTTDKLSTEDTDKLNAQDTDKSNIMGTDEPSNRITYKVCARDTDKPADRDTDKPADRDTDKPADRDTDKLGARDTDEPGARDTDKPADRDADKLGARDTDELGARDTDKLGARDTDELGARDTDKPADRDTDKLGARDTDKLGARDTDEPGTKDTDKPGARDTDKPGTKDTDKPGAKDTDKPGTKDTDKPGAKDTDKPADRDTDKPGARDTDKLGARDTDEPGTMDTDKPGARDTDKLGARDTDKPGARDTDKPGAKDTDKPGAMDTDQPNTQDTDVHSAIDMDEPSIMDTDTPSIIDTDKLNAQDNNIDPVKDGSLRSEDYKSDTCIKGNNNTDISGNVDHVQSEINEKNDNNTDFNDVKNVQQFVGACVRMASQGDHNLKTCYVMVKKIEWE
ncbi:hypothetical protein ACF0H5_009646 [Mactra antiquata]